MDDEYLSDCLLVYFGKKIGWAPIFKFVPCYVQLDAGSCGEKDNAWKATNQAWFGPWKIYLRGMFYK
jgi:hypothetical protein